MAKPIQPVTTPSSAALHRIYKFLGREERRAEGYVLIPGAYIISAERALIEIVAFLEALQLRHAAVENIEARIRRIDRVLAMIRHQACRQ